MSHPAYGAHTHTVTVSLSGRSGRAMPDPPRHEHILYTTTNKRAVPNLDAIQSSGPGTSISGTWIHLVVSWSDVTGRTPPPRRPLAMPAMLLPYGTANAAVSSCWGLPDLVYTTCLPTSPPAPTRPPEGTPPLAGVGSSLDPWRALGSSLPCHAAMQGPLQRRDWNRLR